jgi:hypothetical protein
MANKVPVELDETDDFGFTFVDDEEIIKNAPVSDEVKDLKNRLQGCKKMFLPLLEKLAKDPDKAMIKWPNRKDVIEKQIKKLLELTTVK